MRMRSPVAGSLRSIAEAPDPVFAEKMMGDGYVVFPSGGEILAPSDGEVIMVAAGRHALALRTVEGVEYMIHVGIDTVRMDGEGFSVLVKEDDAVKAGEPLMKFDAGLIRQKAKSDAVLVVFTTGEAVRLIRDGDVAALDEVAEII